MNDLAATRDDRGRDRTFFFFNAALSIAALSFLAYILLLRRGTSTGLDLRFMPAVNAGFNATAATLLACGWVSIRRGARRAHKYFMVSAFAASSLFLVGYLAYHYVHGDTKFQGSGAIRTVYLLILASHILLSAAIVPLSLSSFYFQWRQRWTTHRKVGRVVLPIWLYVSVTGVVIYFMLRGSLPAH